MPHVDADDPAPPSSHTPLLARDTPAGVLQVFSQVQLPGVAPVITLVPSHVPARHWLQAARVLVLPPPDVNQPGRHVLQLPAPPVEYLLSAPHDEQTMLPWALNLPAGQLTTTLEPAPHALPAGHALHAERVVLVPPDVNEPAAQTPHAFAPAAANIVSLPHGDTLLVPSHA